MFHKSQSLKGHFPHSPCHCRYQSPPQRTWARSTHWSSWIQVSPWKFCSTAVGKSYHIFALGWASNSPNDRPANGKKTNSLDSHVPALRSPTWIRHGGCLFPTPQKMHNPRFKSHEPSHRHLSSIGLHRGASIGQAGAPHLSSTSQWNQRVKSHLSPLGLVSIYVTSFDMVMNCHFLVMKSHVLLFNHVVHI